MISYDDERHVLTAALIGMAVGAAVTLLLRQGPSGRRPITTGLAMAGRGARWAGHAGAIGGRKAVRQARRGMERGTEMIGDAHLDEWKEQIADYLDAFKGAIEDTVREEIKDLRKAMRHQRRRLRV